MHDRSGPRNRGKRETNALDKIPVWYERQAHVNHSTTTMQLPSEAFMTAAPLTSELMTAVNGAAAWLCQVLQPPTGMAPPLGLGAERVLKPHCPPSGQEPSLSIHVACQKFCFVVFVVVYRRMRAGTFQLEGHISLYPVLSDSLELNKPQKAEAYITATPPLFPHREQPSMKMNDALQLIKASLKALLKHKKKEKGPS